METDFQAYNTLEYAQWLEARHTRPTQPNFTMRHYERSFGVMEESTVRIYATIGRFLELVEGDIDYLRPQWKLLDNGHDDPSVYSSFRVFIKTPGGEERECGYDDPPTDFAMGEDRMEAFNSMIDACELVDTDIWNHFAQSQVFMAGKITTQSQLTELMKNEKLDEFIAAREQWAMERQTQPASATSRPAARM